MFSHLRRPCAQLNNGSAAQLLTDQVGDCQLVPSLEVQCSTPEGLLALIEYASALRATHATGVHDASSRSHAVCRIGIQRASAQKGQSGSLTLVDLAGSEQRIDTDKHDARRTKESAHINSSLMSLKDSVRALARGEEFGQLAGRSSLTKILKASFTGRESQTLVLATISPASKDSEHTVNTLRHACVMDGRPSEDGKAWITGGAVKKEDIGEVDVKRTKAKLKAEEERGGRGRPGSGAGWTNSGGSGDGPGGFGYVANDGVGGEAAAADRARREEQKVKQEEARRQRKAAKDLHTASAEQHGALQEAREAHVRTGASLNPHQYARIRYKQIEQQQASEVEASELADEVVAAAGCTHEAALRAVQAAGPTGAAGRRARFQLALELLREAEAAKAAAGMSAQERNAAKQARLDKSREACNRRRGRAAYLASLPHWERAAAERRLDEEEGGGGAQAAYEEEGGGAQAAYGEDGGGAQAAYEEGCGEPDSGAREAGDAVHARAPQGREGASTNADAIEDGGGVRQGRGGGGGDAEEAMMSVAEKKAARQMAAAERRQAAEEAKKAAIMQKMAAREAREAAAEAELKSRLEAERRERERLDEIERDRLEEQERRDADAREWQHDGYDDVDGDDRYHPTQQRQPQHSQRSQRQHQQPQQQPPPPQQQQHHHQPVAVNGSSNTSRFIL